MITAKVFELRDSATFIPVIAILVDPNQFLHNPHAVTPAERYLLRRAGYPHDEVNVILCDARGAMGKRVNGTCSPYDWSDRTYQTAHNYIIENWAKLTDGQVIDVEHILGERPKPKLSEAITNGF